MKRIPSRKLWTNKTMEEKAWAMYEIGMNPYEIYEQPGIALPYRKIVNVISENIRRMAREKVSA